MSIATALLVGVLALLNLVHAGSTGMNQQEQALTKFGSSEVESKRVRQNADISSYLAFLTEKELQGKEKNSETTTKLCGTVSPLVVIVKSILKKSEPVSRQQLAVIFAVLDRKLPGTNLMLFSKHIAYKQCLYRSIDGNYL